MPKMTMQQEIEMLHKEVALLRERQKEDSVSTSLATENNEKNLLEQSEDMASSLKDRAGQIEDDLKEQIEDTIETLKKDYETISPVSALILFALGAVFGRALSSK